VIDARARIAQLRAEGQGPCAIARRLNADGIPTPAGLLGRWRPETVWRVENPGRAAAYMREWRRDVKANGPRRWRRRWE
jgi:Recombinase